MSVLLHSRTRIPGLLNINLAPTWSPLSLASCILWYSADNLSLTNGDPISAITDKSPSGYDGSSTGAARPTYTTNVLNGKPSMHFWGDQKIDHPRMTGKYTYVVAWQKYNQAGNDYLLGIDGTTYCFLQYGNIWYVGGGASVDKLHPSGEFHVKIAAYDSGSVRAYTDGVLDSEPTVDTQMDSTQIGSPGGYECYGEIFEYLVFDTALSPTNLALVSTYINSKYGY
jgi:hypothetical protein